jgi:pyrroline-5-carboxylate reductase
MIDTAVHLGLSRPLATEIVIRTVKGSTDYLAMRKEHPAVLRNEVTSPGGTTAEAVFELEKLGFRNAIAEAMWACYERTIELGKGSEGSH